MSLAKIFLKCWEQGIALFPEGNNLRYRGPEGTVTEEILFYLSENKKGLLQILYKNYKVIYSKALEKLILVSWEGNDPKVILIDQTSYSLEEIQRIKKFNPVGVDIKTIHELKEIFQGQVL